MRRRKSSIVMPFVGDGKLTEYKQKKDSWIYNQMQNGKYTPGIKIVNDEFIRFSFVQSKIASQILSQNFDYKKCYKILSKNQIQMCWFVYSKIDNSTVKELNEVSEMLKNFSDCDLMTLKKSIIEKDIDLSIAQNDVNMNVKINNQEEKIYLNRKVVLIGNQVQKFIQILRDNFFEEII